MAKKIVVLEDNAEHDVVRNLADAGELALAHIRDASTRIGFNQRPHFVESRLRAGDHTRRCVRVPGESAELDSRNGRVSCAVPAYALSTRCHPWLVSARIR